LSLSALNTKWRLRKCPDLTLCFTFHSVIGLPEEEDWPNDVALPRNAFASRPAQPIEKFVPDIDDMGKDLLLVSFHLFCPNCMTDSCMPRNVYVSV